LEKKLFTYVILAVLVWAILGTFVAGYYFVQFDIYHREYNNLADQFNSISLKVNILLDYGNGTRVWYNNTVLPLGSTAFNATCSIADVDKKDYGEPLGILVTSINGVANNNPYGWFYCYWDSKNSEWIFPTHSCAKHILHEGDTIAFTYDSWPPQPPT